MTQLKNQCDDCERESANLSFIENELEEFYLCEDCKSDYEEKENPCPGCRRDRPRPFRYIGNKYNPQEVYLCGDCFESAVDSDNQIAEDNYRDAQI